MRILALLCVAGIVVGATITFLRSEKMAPELLERSTERQIDGCVTPVPARRG